MTDSPGCAAPGGPRRKPLALSAGGPRAKGGRLTKRPSRSPVWVDWVLCGAFVWARGALKRPKRRFPARAVAALLRVLLAKEPSARCTVAAAKAHAWFLTGASAGARGQGGFGPPCASSHLLPSTLPSGSGWWRPPALFAIVLGPLTHGPPRGAGSDRASAGAMARARARRRGSARRRTCRSGPPRGGQAPRRVFRCKPVLYGAFIHGRARRLRTKNVGFRPGQGHAKPSATWLPRTSLALLAAGLDGGIL